MKGLNHHHHQHSSSRTHSLVTDKSRRQSSSSSARFSDISSISSNGRYSRKMKFIISVGIALPIIAAVIGVVAWAMSAEVTHPGPNSSSLKSSDDIYFNSNLFPMFENRNDFDLNSESTFNRNENVKLPSRSQKFNQESKMHATNRQPNSHETDDGQNPSRLDGGFDKFAQQNDLMSHSLPRSIGEDDSKKDDPLYIVHFVPSSPPRSESSTSNLNNPTTPPDDVLDKILSVTKGKKSGIPQFVVFAPVPGSEGLPPIDDTQNEAPENSRETAENEASSIQANNNQYDYEYIEKSNEAGVSDNSKIQELNSKEQKQRKVARIGETVSSEKNTVQTSDDMEIFKSLLQAVSNNVTTGNVYSSQTSGRSTSNQNSNNAPQITQTQPSDVPQTNAHQYQPPQQPRYYPAPRNPVAQSPPQQAYMPQPPPQQAYMPQPSPQQPYVPQQPPQQAYMRPPQQQAYMPRPQQTYAPRNPDYLPEQSQYQPQYNSPQQQNEPDRSGQIGPVGLRFSLGDGGWSPLGIIGNLLRRILPKPKVNLNGKVMFGVMLEHGLKFDHRNPPEAYIAAKY